MSSETLPAIPHSWPARAWWMFVERSGHHLAAGDSLEEANRKAEAETRAWWAADGEAALAAAFARMGPLFKP